MHELVHMVGPSVLTGICEDLLHACRAFFARVGDRCGWVSSTRHSHADKDVGNKVLHGEYPAKEVAVVIHLISPSCGGCTSHDSRTGGAVNRAPGEELSDEFGQLPMPSADGKLYRTDEVIS
ncbi:hypothetical protein HH800_01045 [Sphingobium yanoikuyae]|uniref:Uncharacterized protein n=1 Tax=Sphingobium yanoikuyae TaxID=13690 RepID=A0A6M4G1Z7_SPHYA|nr:hypothetical protein [Sphingobium yanoikuyae]QJR00906.1 hypothetical protein HH800_01045 [Sphingobium yanoikuyae]